MEADQGYLGRARQVQVVGGDRVGLLAVRGELAGADQRLLADQRRDADQREALAGEDVEGVGLYRTLEQDQIGRPARGRAPRPPCGPARSPPSRASPGGSTWSSGVKPNSGGVPTVRITTLADSSGPTGAPAHGMVGVSSSSAFSRSVGLGQLLAQRPEPGPRAQACSALSSARLAFVGLRRDCPAGGALPASPWAWSSSCWSSRLSPVEVEQLVDVQVDALHPDRRPLTAFAGFSLISRLSSMGTRQSLRLM